MPKRVPNTEPEKKIGRPQQAPTIVKIIVPPKLIEEIDKHYSGILDRAKMSSGGVSPQFGLEHIPNSYANSFTPVWIYITFH